MRFDQHLSAKRQRLTDRQFRSPHPARGKMREPLEYATSPLKRPEHHVNPKRSFQSSTMNAMVPFALAVLYIFCILPIASAITPDQPKQVKTTSREAMMRASELPETVIFLEQGTDPNEFASTHGLTLKRALKSDPNGYVFATGTVNRAKAVKQDVESDKRVRKSYVNHRSRHVKHGFTPNDPYFNRNTPAAGWNGDWHLINEIGTGIDVRVKTAWDQDITGQGVILGIVDDSLQIDHPDIEPNYDAEDSWDFGQNDSNPSPVHSDDDHGTVVAGTAAARGGNGIGVSGAAPLASLAGLRLDFYSSDDAAFADATMYHSNGANHSISIKNHSYGYPDPWIDGSLERDALASSAAVGTIHVFSAGNDRGNPGKTSDANKDIFQNSPDVITVGAIDTKGKYKYYSDFGACLFVTAPSGLLSTDRTSSNGFNTGNTNDTFYFPNADYAGNAEGTSFSSPLAAGVLALVKQIQPRLDVRFAKHLLARYSDKVDLTDASPESDGGWKTNAAGLSFNQNYGFGLINATRLVQMAPKFGGVSPLWTETSGLINVNRAIPDNDTIGTSAQYALASTTPLEEMEVSLQFTHSHVGDLEVTLTSPRGTTSRLVMKDSGDDGSSNLDDQDNPSDHFNWTFLSNTFWGENPSGVWRVTVKDLLKNNTGTWSTFTLTARMGYLLQNSSAEFIDYP